MTEGFGGSSARSRWLLLEVTYDYHGKEQRRQDGAPLLLGGLKLTRRPRCLAVFGDGGYAGKIP